MRIDIGDGALRTLSPRSAVPLGGTWNRDGTILFADNPGGPILRIAASGGEAVAVTRVDGQQRGHYFPAFLPDGRHFVFLVYGSPEVRGIYHGELGSMTVKRLFAADTPAVYAGTGHLLFVRDGKLLAQPFDAARGELEGDVFPVDENLAEGTRVSAAVSGSIAYRGGASDTGQRQLAWFDRSGRELDKVTYAGNAAQGPAMSRDGSRIAVFRFIDGNMDIWSYETRRRTWERITYHRGDDIYPLWSSDGRSIVYGAVRKPGPVNVYRRVVDAPPESEELLLAESAFPMDWSRDGRFLLYNTAPGKSGSDLWALPLEGERKPIPVVKTDFSEGVAEFSPDGKWVAYESDKSGRLEVYVRPFPGPGPDVRASTDGGSQPRWNPAGHELFYIAEDDRLMSVPVQLAADGTSVEPGTPVALFTTNVGSAAVLKYRQQYVVSPDGKSFVMNAAVEQANASPINVILNWKPRR